MSRDNVGEALFVVLCKAVACGLRGSSLKIVKIAVLLLIVGEAFSHMVKHFLGELLSLTACHILAYPFGVETRFVHTYETDGGEMIIEGAQVTLGVRVQTRVHKLCDDLTLDFKAACGNVHNMVKASVKISLVRCKISDSGNIYGYNAHRARGLAASEETAGFLTKLTQVKTEATAHGSDIAGLHIGVDIV